MPEATIGVIGGSGLYRMAELTGVEELSVSTPFGDPSDAFFIGTLAGAKVAFLPRHGHRLCRKHRPSGEGRRDPPAFRSRTNSRERVARSLSNTARTAIN